LEEVSTLSWNINIIKSLNLEVDSIINYFSDYSFQDVLKSWQAGFVFNHWSSSET